MYIYVASALLLSACILHVYISGRHSIQLCVPSGNYSVSMKSREIVVVEDVGMVEVCAILSSSSLLTFPLANPVTVRLRTVDGISCMFIVQDL